MDKLPAHPPRNQRSSSGVSPFFMQLAAESSNFSSDLSQEDHDSVVRRVQVYIPPLLPLVCYPIDVG